MHIEYHIKIAKSPKNRSSRRDTATTDGGKPMRQKYYIKEYGSIFLVLACMSLSLTATGQTDKPKVLIIWGDDVGTWNISAYPPVQKAANFDFSALNRPDWVFLCNGGELSGQTFNERQHNRPLVAVKSTLVIKWLNEKNRQFSAIHGFSWKNYYLNVADTFSDQPKKCHVQNIYKYIDISCTTNYLLHHLYQADEIVFARITALTGNILININGNSVQSKNANYDFFAAVCSRLQERTN